ncbi:MAG: phospholipase D family protein [Gammaproteobacteria bacterium]|nr:phospholipase D family protein [Gammaproteobacteria bacterium]
MQTYSFSRYLSILILLSCAGCAALPDNSNLKPSYAIEDTSHTRIAHLLAKSPQYNNGKNGFVLLGDGLDAFVARAQLAESADISIDVQYYLFHSDDVGKLFSGVLWKAADRGVRVRLLIDDMDLKGRDNALVALNNHPNIEVRVFNPFNRSMARLPQYVTGFGSITRRMHNKSFNVDNLVSIVGGRNIGNEYFNANPSLAFSDLDVIAAGKVAKEVSRSFDEYWNSSSAYTVDLLLRDKLDKQAIKSIQSKFKTFLDVYSDSPYVKALKNSKLSQQLKDGRVQYFWGKADVVADHPNKIVSSRDANDLHLMTQLAPHFQSVKNQLIMVSPYFVPGEEGVEFFQKMIDKGVSVKILTNSLASSDVSFVHAGYSDYREELLRIGVELYEMNKMRVPNVSARKGRIGDSSKASLHAKTFVLDDEKIFVGSLNLDPRSFYENSEIGMVIESKEMAQTMSDKLKQIFERDVFKLELTSDGEIIWHGYEQDEKVIFNTDPYTSVWQRFSAWFLSLLPIESQL